MVRIKINQSRGNQYSKYMDICFYLFLIPKLMILNN